MDVGTLRHRITIQSATTAEDEFGQPIESWATFAEAWASVEQLTGREYFQAQQTQAETMFRVRIRYLSGVEQTMRVIHGAMTLEILAVLNTYCHSREMQLMCREVK